MVGVVKNNVLCFVWDLYILYYTIFTLKYKHAINTMLLSCHSFVGNCFGYNRNVISGIIIYGDKYLNAF
jgi:hypothetical protein